MNYFIFVVNDMMIDNMRFSGMQIAQELLSHYKWKFTYSTPNLKRIKPGDAVVIYRAGKGSRCFTSQFTISSSIVETTDIIISGVVGFAISNAFPLTCDIENVEIWGNPLPISFIKQNLGFITDQKNWGLFFRQSTKLIDKKDYDLIISTASRCNNC